jgi:hypothetical protein
MNFRILFLLIALCNGKEFIINKVVPLSALYSLGYCDSVVLKSWAFNPIDVPVVLQKMKLAGVDSAWSIDPEKDPFIHDVEYVVIFSDGAGNEGLKLESARLGDKAAMPVICYREDDKDSGFEKIPLIDQAKKKSCPSCILV